MKEEEEEEEEQRIFSDGDIHWKYQFYRYKHQGEGQTKIANQSVVRAKVGNK